MAQESDPPKDRSTILAEERTDLAVTRTRLAAERTLQAWVRTGLSMVSFGFTIYRFLQEIQKDRPPDLAHPHAARNFGLSLVIMGILSLLVGVYQHCALFRQLGLDPFKRPVSWAVVVAFFIFLLGVLCLLGMSAGVGPY
jgi:putative membrane protein